MSQFKPTKYSWQDFRFHKSLVNVPGGGRIGARTPEDRAVCHRRVNELLTAVPGLLEVIAWVEANEPTRWLSAYKGFMSVKTTREDGTDSLLLHWTPWGRYDARRGRNLPTPEEQVKFGRLVDKLDALIGTHATVVVDSPASGRTDGRVTLRIRSLTQDKPAAPDEERLRMEAEQVQQELVAFLASTGAVVLSYRWVDASRGFGYGFRNRWCVRLATVEKTGPGEGTVGRYSAAAQVMFSRYREESYMRTVCAGLKPEWVDELTRPVPQEGEECVAYQDRSEAWGRRVGLCLPLRDVGYARFDRRTGEYGSDAMLALLDWCQERGLAVRYCRPLTVENSQFRDAGWLEVTN